MFLLVGMIGCSLHIGWIEEALFSFGHPYFGTVFFRRRGAAVRVEHGREPDGENRLDGLRSAGTCRNPSPAGISYVGDATVRARSRSGGGRALIALPESLSSAFGRLRWSASGRIRGRGR